MGFEGGQKYRGRAVASEAAITKNTNGTKAAEILVEVTVGPMQGQRIRYRGYLTGPGGASSPRNLETTTNELRAMGWTADRWGSWTGLGSKEFVFTCLQEQGEGDDGRPRVYSRAAFPRALEAVNRARAVAGDELEALPPPPAVVTSGRASTAPASAPSEAEEPADAIPF